MGDPVVTGVTVSVVICVILGVVAVLTFRPQVTGDKPDPSGAKDYGQRAADSEKTGLEVDMSRVTPQLLEAWTGKARERLRNQGDEKWILESGVSSGRRFGAIATFRAQLVATAQTACISLWHEDDSSFWLTLDENQLRWAVQLFEPIAEVTVVDLITNLAKGMYSVRRDLRGRPSRLSTLVDHRRVELTPGTSVTPA